MIQEGTDLISAYCTRLNSMRSAAILDKGKYSYVFRAYSSGEIMFQFVRPALEKIRKCQGESDFSFAPLVRILYLDEEKFEEEARQNIVQCKQEIVDAFAAFPFWPSAQEAKPMNSIVFWSENHLFMTLGAAFLYQQYLETKGMRENIEERSFESQLLLTYLRVHNQQSVAGIYEVNSHVYLPYTLCALLNLFDFSSCQEIKAESFALIGKIVRHMMLCTDPLYGVANLSANARSFPRTRQRNHGHNFNQLLNLLNGKSADDFTPSYLTSFLLTTKWQPDKAIFDALFHDGFVNVVMSHSVEETLKLYEQFKPKGVDLGDLAPLFWSAGLVTHPQFATITRSYIRNRYLSRNVHLWLISSFFFTDGMFARIMRQYKHFSAGQVYAGITLNVYKRPKSGIVMSSFELYNPHYCGYQQLPWMINLAGIPIWSRSGLGSESVVGFGIHNTHNPAVQQRDDIMLVSYITPPILTSLLVGSIFSHRVHLFWPDKLFEDVVVTESNNQSAANTTLRATAHCTSTQCECECKATRISASNMRYWLVGKFKDCYIAVLFTKAYTCSDEVDKASYFIPQIDGPKVPISRLYCDEKQVSIVLVIATIADYPTINDFLKQRLELISVRETVNEVNSIYNIEIDDKSKNIKIDYSCDINNPYRE